MNLEHRVKLMEQREKPATDDIDWERLRRVHRRLLNETPLLDRLRAQAISEAPLDESLNADLSQRVNELWEECG